MWGIIRAWNTINDSIITISIIPNFSKNITTLTKRSDITLYTIKFIRFILRLTSKWIFKAFYYYINLINIIPIAIFHLYFSSLTVQSVLRTGLTLLNFIYIGNYQGIGILFTLKTSNKLSVINLVNFPHNACPKKYFNQFTLFYCVKINFIIY